MRAPGERKRLRRLPVLLAALLVLGVGGAAAVLKIRERRILYHFREVEPGVLYRSGQLDRRGLEKVHRREGIKTIIDLANEYRDHPRVVDQLAFTKENGIRYLNLPLPPRAEGIEPHLEEFLKTVDDPAKRPVLLHCWNGVIRTGLLNAIFRMEYQRATNAEALAGLALFGRDVEDFHPAERRFIEEYVPRWKRRVSSQ